MDLRSINASSLRTDIPEFKAGDRLVVKSKIKEGNKERVQAYEGVCIKRQGSGIAETFTVRKMSAGIGVEKVFPVHSPRLVSVERKMEGFVRRSRIYYMRKLDGKAARIQDKRIKLMEAQGGALTKAEKKKAEAAKKRAEKAAAKSSEESKASSSSES